MLRFLRTLPGVQTTLASRLMQAARVAFLSLFLLSSFNGAKIDGAQFISSAQAANISGEIDPSEVYALWQEINRGILIYAELSEVSDEVMAQLGAVEPEAYQEKMPRDVYARVNAMRGEFNRVLGSWLVPNYHGGALLEEEIIRYMTLDGDTVTPLTVYLRSLFLFEALLKTIAAIDPARHDISSFFAAQADDVRQPGDVYILVGMAQKRLRILSVSIDIEGTNP